MSRIGPGPKRLREIERILKADIRWTIEKGPGWNPGYGADLVNGAWVPDAECGTCAIGALVCRRQPSQSHSHFQADIASAARVLRSHFDWTRALYYAVGLAESAADVVAFPSAISLARRLRAYGDKLAAKATRKAATP